MKNMDYEKKYNDALNWMRELYPGLHGATKEDAEHYFPELKESEDERIRKFLLRLAKRCVENSIDFSGDIKKKDVIDWLERQKDNLKSSDSIPPDCVINAKCEDRWRKVEESLPDNGRLVLAKDSQTSWTTPKNE